MSKKFHGLLLTKEQFKFRTFNGDLQEYYDLLECTTIDITSIKFGDKYYDVICDDEGLFKPNNHVSICSEAGSPMIVGNVIICNHNDEGEETSLTNHEAWELYRHAAWTSQPTGKNGIMETVPVLVASV